jgi:regulator of sirC expression with transglutaminase-like and TPR domain
VVFPLHLQSRAVHTAAELHRAIDAPGEDLAGAALAIARVEYPALDSSHYVALLDRMGSEAAARVSGVKRGSEDVIRVLNEYLYDEQGFSGNREHYDDPRNSFLNEVLDRRTGIPISIAVVYMEVARRADVRVTGINFPGHFLLCATTGPAATLPRGQEADADDRVIIDPFHGGARLSEYDCRELLRQHIGDDEAFDPELLRPANRHDIVVRMLVNLKRLYVRMQSFPQARFTSDLLLSVDPSAITELRDRGLLAYHLQDFAAALRDLETYLSLLPRHSTLSGADGERAALEGDTEGAVESENAQIWEHVKTLRRRVAGFN